MHLDVRPGNGGDSLAIVEDAQGRLKRAPGRREISEKLVLLDADRVQQDARRGRDAQTQARRWNFKVILQKPNLEGLILRLCPGQDQRQVAARDALTELRKVWPQYSKPPTVAQLSDRFGVDDLRRAARHDRALQELLDTLGL